MYRVNNRGDVTEILIYDDIGEGWFGGVSSKQIVDDVSNAKGSTINVRLNSPGGDVFEGFAIHNALKGAEQRIEVDIDALAASAASVVAMAGDEIRMADNSMLMIHNAWTIAGGDSREFQRMSALLEQINGNIAQAYVAKSGMTDDEVRELMDAETWFTASEAEAVGLADVVTSELSVAAAAFDRSRFRNTPERFNLKEEPKESSKWKAQSRERRLRLMRLSS